MKRIRFIRGGGARRAGIRWIAVLMVVSGGCGAPQRDAAEYRGPYEAFDELTKRALADDFGYVRDHLAPSYYERVRATGVDPVSESHHQELARQLALCRPMECAKEDRAAGTAVIEGASVNPGLLGGTLARFKVDMTYDARRGWRLAGPMYDVRPFAEE